MTEPWSGCHGVCLPALAIDLGRATGEPLLTAAVTVGEVGEPGGEELWHLELDVEAGGELVHAEQRLWRRPDGTLLLRSNRGGALAVDSASSTIVIAGRDDAALAQLLATYGLPLLLHDAPALVVHGSAFEVDGGAVIVCGDPGRGK